MTAPLEHSLEREIVICAERTTVFRYFTDSERFAAWWGAGSSIDARPGGVVEIHYPGSVVAVGEVVELDAGRRIVFTYGYASGQPVPPGSTLVTIELADDPAGTRLSLRHDFADPGVRDEHVGGWQYQLALFANVASNEQHGALAARADRMFSAWRQADPDERRATLEGCVAPDIEFRDTFACASGLDELVNYIGAAQKYMPDMILERAAEPRHCQGVALVDWHVVGRDGEERGHGTNVVTLTPAGLFHSVTAIWGPTTPGQG